MPETAIVRPGRQDDIPYIRDMTRNTFQWGDYVGDVFPQWLEDPKNDLYVAEMDGQPVGVTHVRYLSPREAWFEGIRVNRDYRRHGIGRLLTEASIQGARQRGAKVCRAAIDSDNEKSSGLARGLGFSPVEMVLEFKKIAWAPSDDGSGPSDSGATCYDAARSGNACSGTTHSGTACSSTSPVTVRLATEHDADPLADAASRFVGYVGCDYTWRQLDRDGIAQDLASGANILLAENPGEPGMAHTVTGGAWLGEFYFEKDHLTGTETALIDIGSIFGDPESVGELIVHAEKALERARDQKGLKARLMSVQCPATNPVRIVLPSFGFTQDEDTIVLWELRL